MKRISTRPIRTDSIIISFVNAATTVRLLWFEWTSSRPSIVMTTLTVVTPKTRLTLTYTFFHSLLEVEDGSC